MLPPKDGVASDTLVGTPHALISELGAVRVRDLPRAIHLVLSTRSQRNALGGPMSAPWPGLEFGGVRGVYNGETISFSLQNRFACVRRMSGLHVFTMMNRDD